MGRLEGGEAMMDFNSSSSLSGQVTAFVDFGMQRLRSEEVPRD